jgi:hypothetical protein
MTPGKLYRLKKEIGRLHLSTKAIYEGKHEYRVIKTVDNDSILLYLKEEIMDAYEGTGPYSKRLYELYFLCNDEILTCTNIMANYFEEIENIS